MGDFNLDLLQYNHHTPTQEFIDALFSFAFFPLISNPTRLTSSSATLIDNIFTNNLSQNVLNGVVLNDLSDHLPGFAYFSGLTLTRDGENKAFMRKFTDENLHKFNESVSNTNWSSLVDEDPNIAYSNFIQEYSIIYNACFPLKAIKGKLLNNRSSPWISPGLLKSISKKTRLYKKFIRSPSLSNEQIYKTYKNKLNHLIRLAKRKYYDTRFESAKHDLRTTWKLLNEVVNKRKSRAPFPSLCTAAPFPQKNRKRDVCDLPLIIVFKDHVTFSGMCGKWFDWLFPLHDYITKIARFDWLSFSRVSGTIGAFSIASFTLRDNIM